jgi:hypothetical protein
MLSSTMTLTWCSTSSNIWIENAFLGTFAKWNTSNSHIFIYAKVINFWKLWNVF